MRQVLGHPTVEEEDAKKAAYGPDLHSIALELREVYEQLPNRKDSHWAMSEQLGLLSFDVTILTTDNISMQLKISHSW